MHSECFWMKGHYRETEYGSCIHEQRDSKRHFCVFQHLHLTFYRCRPIYVYEMEQ